MEPRQVAEAMLAGLDLDLVSCSELQTLWAGYGHICALEARSRNDSTDTQRLILKLISPPSSQDPHQPAEEGHVRKMLSYQVEQFWYDELAPRLDSEVAVARCLVTTRSRPFADQGGLTMATILTDLRVNFPVAVHRSLTPCQVYAALDWLARFHGSSWRWLPRDRDSFLGPPLQEVGKKRGKKGYDNVLRPAAGLWLNGGYTYLATRRREYAALAIDDASEWCHALCQPGADGQASLAEQAAAFLAPGGGGERWQTCIHGDVKSENLFANLTGDAVAFFDFQYVGLGLGVCDLAKLFTCSVPLNMLLIPDDDDDDDEVVVIKLLTMTKGERELLERYRASLLQSQKENPIGSEYDWDDLVRHWETALVDWCRFQASWGFWGNTEWLQARVRNIVRDVGWRDWLQQQQS